MTHSIKPVDYFVTRHNTLVQRIRDLVIIALYKSTLYLTLPYWLANSTQELCTTASADGSDRSIKIALIHCAEMCVNAQLKKINACVNTIKN